MSYRVAIEQFRNECRKNFGFLVDQYGLKERLVDREYKDEKFQVSYVSKTVKVVVLGTHWGAGVSVRIGRVVPDPWEIYGSYDLEDLIKIRAPELSLLDQYGFGKSVDQSLQLQHYANALRVVGDDVLKGEFGVFPRLHEAITKRQAGA